MKAVELSEKTGISKSSLSSYISNRWQPKQEALYKMAKALEVSEMWLAGYDVPKERPVEQIRADELAQIVHRLRKDNNMKNLVSSMCKLSSDQLNIVGNMVNEFNKINHQE
jgi:transcriptional regulator with XRE-family HTH domain